MSDQQPPTWDPPKQVTASSSAEADGLVEPQLDSGAQAAHLESIAPTATDEIPTAPSKRPRRFWRVLGFVAWTCGIAGLGIGLGLRLAERLDDTTFSPAEVNVIAAAPSSASGDETEADQVVMPDLVGLSRDEAMETLVDSGVALDTIIENQAPWIGDAARIVSQRPVQGSLDPTAVFLGVSAPATVPDVVGIDINEALSRLQAIGIVPGTSRRYEPGAEPGTVLETTPAAGSLAPREVSIVSAAAPTALYATSVRADSRGCSSSNSLEILAQEFQEGLSCRVRASSTDPVIQTYTVDGLAESIETTVGLASSTSGVRATLVVLVDGVAATTIDLSSSSSDPITVPLVGVSQVSFEMRLEDDGSNPTADVLLGDPIFLGAPENMDALERR